MSTARLAHIRRHFSQNVGRARQAVNGRRTSWRKTKILVARVTRDGIYQFKTCISR
jgi:hypothetical protein